MTVDIALN